MLEDEMQDRGVAWLRKQPENEAVIREVPIMHRCADAIILKKDGTICSIEFKISKWQHAIEQAACHSTAVDKAYICLPMRTVTSKLSAALRCRHIGLMLYDPIDGSVRVALEPDRSNMVELFRKQLIERIEMIGEEK